MILQPDAFEDMRDFESRLLYDYIKQNGTLDTVKNFAIYVISRMTGEMKRLAFAGSSNQYEQVISLAEHLARERIMVASIFMSHRVEVEIEQIGEGRKGIPSDGILIYGGTFSIEIMAMGYNAAYFSLTSEGDRFRPGRLTRLFADPNLVHANGNAVTGFIRTYCSLMEQYSIFPSPEFS